MLPLHHFPSHAVADIKPTLVYLCSSCPSFLLPLHIPDENQLGKEFRNVPNIQNKTTSLKQTSGECYFQALILSLKLRAAGITGSSAPFLCGH
jgi:hypothetical protein